jgi:hypothetical protein
MRLGEVEGDADPLARFERDRTEHARNGAARQARRTVARGKARRCAANLGALDRGKKSLLAPPIAG